MSQGNALTQEINALTHEINQVVGGKENKIERHNSSQGIAR